MQNNVSDKKGLQFYRQCPVIAEASDFPRTFPNMSKRSFSLTLIGAYFSLREIRIWSFANGYDDSPVKLENTHAPIKSVGNSTTTPKDLVCDEDVKIVLYILAESVAASLVLIKTYPTKDKVATCVYGSTREKLQIESSYDMKD